MKDVVRPIAYFVFYVLVGAALYFLYSPLNPHPKNQTRSTVQFVYQQF